MPIDTSLLQPVERPQPFNFASLMQSLDQGNAMRTNVAVGQQAAGGDYAGAQATALRAGNLPLAGQTIDLDNADHKAKVMSGIQTLSAINTQADWNRARAAIIAKGAPDPGDFANKDRYIGSLTDSLNPEAAATRKQVQSNADRTAGFEQQRINLAREAATNKGAGGSTEYGLAPVYGHDAQGNIVIMQPSKAGGLRVAEPPDGVRPMGPGDKAADVAAGKVTGVAAVNLPTVENSASRLLSGIDSVLKDPGLKGITGGIQGRIPNIFKMGDAARAQSQLEKIQAGTFLQAYNDIRGAGAITEAEGAKATAAYNRLAHQEMSDADYRDALIEFRGEVQRLVEVARQKAGRGAGGAPAAQPADAAPAGGGLPAGTYNWTPDGGLGR